MAIEADFELNLFYRTHELLTLILSTYCQSLPIVRLSVPKDQVKNEVIVLRKIGESVYIFAFNILIVI